jgi:hypothetical protein
MMIERTKELVEEKYKIVNGYKYDAKVNLKVNLFGKITNLSKSNNDLF